MREKNIKMNPITKSNPRGAGRPKVADKRGPLPYRLRASVIEKAKRLGRDRVEAIIEREKES